MKLILFANTDWHLYNFRRSLALAAKSEGHDVLLVSQAYGQKLSDLGLRWIPAPMERRSLNPFHELALFVWLWRLVRSEKADVVHSFTIKWRTRGAVGWRGPGQCRCGNGLHFHKRRTVGVYAGPIVWALLRLALGGVRTRLILQNVDDISLLRKTGIGLAAHIRLIPGSGLDCRRFLPPDETFPILGSLRQRLSQANVLSTIQRLGRTKKPVAWSERLTIFTFTRPRAFFTAA
jgi:hypothetical protein